MHIIKDGFFLSHSFKSDNCSTVKDQTFWRRITFTLMLLGGVVGVGYAYSLTIISIEDEISEQISNSCLECCSPLLMYLLMQCINVFV